MGQTQVNVVNRTKFAFQVRREFDTRKLLLELRRANEDEGTGRFYLIVDQSCPQASSLKQLA